MRLLDVLQRSAVFLASRGVESSRLEAEWLLARVLGLPRLQLYLQFERVLTEPELAEARSMVQRRGQRIPLQHLLGTAVFCGREMETSGAALIPRPETEGLVERAVAWLRGRAMAPDRAWEVLDWGTGTGCLAVTLALEVPRARVTAVEVSPDAVALARRNAERHGCGDRVRVLLSDGMAEVEAGRRFDLVVANPPYIPSGDLAGLAPEVRDHDPRLALDGGEDGLEVYRRLGVELQERLAPGGAWFCEFGDGQAADLSDMLRRQGWLVVAVHRDDTMRDRILHVERTS
jgi:release factor glutamine methyltransferase